MKKMLIIIAMLAMPHTVKAEGSILDQLYGGFVGRAKLSVETTTDGTIQPEFLVNYLEVGKIDTGHIFAVDAGVLGEVLPETGETNGAQWTVGGKFHLQTLIKKYVPLPAEWDFLKILEIDARGSYNLTENHPTWGLVASVPFK